jgi:hypothetical protein
LSSFVRLLNGESRQEVRAAVLGGRLAAEALERADEVVLVVEAALVRNLGEKLVRRGQEPVI